MVLDKEKLFEYLQLVIDNKISSCCFKDYNGNIIKLHKNHYNNEISIHIKYK